MGKMKDAIAEYARFWFHPYIKIMEKLGIIETKRKPPPPPPELITGKEDK
jgi:hypothetical protein